MKNSLKKEKIFDHSYIKNAFKYIESNQCYDQDGRLKIDGDYGDYRMKIFRNKDKLAYYSDSKSIFQDNLFNAKIQDYAKSGMKANLDIDHIVGDNNEESDDSGQRNGLNSRKV